MIKLAEIMNQNKVTPRMVSNLYTDVFSLPNSDPDEIQEFFNECGYEDYLENYTVPGKAIGFYEYLQQKGLLGKAYSGLTRLKNKYNASFK